MVERAVGLVARFAGALGAVLTVLCVALVGYAVGMRYLLGQPEPWTDKVAGWLVVGVVMLAAPEAQRRFEHIGVDVARSRLGPRLAWAAHLLGTLSVAAVAAVLLDAGIEMVEFSRMIGMMTDLEGVPAWWVQALLPVGAALLLLVALAQSLLLLLGLAPAHLPDDTEEIPRDPLARAE
ncbi:TRAP transporter small permease [Falsiroseomonas selenitidurans]|uniref:TRAP transporter small permease protein n=1 Tax=Falsiroseomonas selenitidurans TaxID=2716335 RepID=A0ABX1EAL6_9PROT|nr:TRAP transporter small permease subunit [Falsiroseomonas selenitidurans]NKC32813.1 TRAP transporter small permease [Falsiroseomonas selenitidurans]